jgi:hypothetical protein
MVFGICGNFVEAAPPPTLEAVELCLECKLLAASIFWEVTAADPLVDECIDAIVFIFALFELALDAPLLVVLLMEFNVPEGLSNTPEVEFSPVGGGRGSLRLNQPCLRAALGVILVTGSHSRHLRMKSRNMGSSQPFNAVWSSRDPGGPRGLPRRERPPLRTVVPSGNVVTVQYRG